MILPFGTVDLFFFSEFCDLIRSSKHDDTARSAFWMHPLSLFFLVKLVFIMSQRRDEETHDGRHSQGPTMEDALDALNQVVKAETTSEQTRSVLRDVATALRMFTSARADRPAMCKLTDEVAGLPLTVREQIEAAALDADRFKINYVTPLKSAVDTAKALGVKVLPEDDFHSIDLMVTLVGKHKHMFMLSRAFFQRCCPDAVPNALEERRSKFFVKSGLVDAQEKLTTDKLHRPHKGGIRFLRGAGGAPCGFHLLHTRLRESPRTRVGST